MNIEGIIRSLESEITRLQQTVELLKTGLQPITMSTLNGVTVLVLHKPLTIDDLEDNATSATVQLWKAEGRKGIFDEAAVGEPPQNPRRSSQAGFARNKRTRKSDLDPTDTSNRDWVLGGPVSD
jgi:hypothetical protein